jgi:hypothetical protein
MIRHDCKATYGVRGAPMQAKADGGWTVVGINVAESLDGSGGLAVVLDEARQYLWGVPSGREGSCDCPGGAWVTHLRRRLDRV